MIFCYDKDGDPLPDHKALTIITSAAALTYHYFPQEAFGIDDLVQESIVRNLPHFPFARPSLLYVASRYRIIDYYRLVAGRNKSKERGGRRMLSIDSLETDNERLSKEPSPDRRAEVQDEIDWALKHLNEVERKIMLAYANKRDGSIKALAEELGVSPSSVSQRYYQIKRFIKETYNHAQQSNNKSIDHRPSRNSTISDLQDSVQVDRQRALKRLENTR